MNTLKTMLYMGVMHGFFTFYFPYRLASRDVPIINMGILQFSAIPFWIIGSLIIIHSSVDIIRRGRGTPAHLDPPKELVIDGFYRYVRNPVYFGAILVLFGYILWFASAWLILYTACAFAGFHLLIILIEEPFLKQKFGTVYKEYMKRVPRWIPRIN